jgi:hypothetical protein
LYREGESFTLSLCEVANCAGCGRTNSRAQEWGTDWTDELGTDIDAEADEEENEEGGESANSDP